MPFDRERFSNLYPFESHWLDVGGARMHYVDEGQGDPVLMVHGNPTWSFYFRELIRALSPTHRVLAPDHIGCGLSDKPGDGEYHYVLERRVADLEALLQHARVERGLTLVLHDWGGMIGMAMAARHPGRVSRIVLLNTAAFMLPPGKRLPFRLWLLRHLPLLPALAVRGGNAFAGLATRMATARGLDPDVAAGLLAPYDSWANRIATLRFVQDIPLAPGDASYALAESTAAALEQFADHPVLIQWGERDFVFDGAFLAEWRRIWPQAEVRTYPEAGHYVLEDAREDVVPAVVEFVTGAPANEA